MPADFGTDLLLARRYYRRKATVDGVLTLALLHQFEDQLAAPAMEAVLLTSSSFEAGTHQGQAQFDRRAALQAVQELIIEADPTLPREVSQTQAVFRACTTPATE